jgi:hypothetical protein
MLHRFRRRSPAIARTLLTVLGTLWLITAVSPCVMAQPHHNHNVVAPVSHHAGMDHAAMNHDGEPPCGPVTAVDCKFQDFASPTGTAVVADMALPPVLLTTLPVLQVLPHTAPTYEHALLVPDIPAPPLPILHSALLF